MNSSDYEDWEELPAPREALINTGKMAVKEGKVKNARG